MNVHYYLQNNYVYIVFLMSGKRYKISTKISMDKKDWNSNTERPYKKHPLQIEISNRLDQIEQDIKKILLADHTGSIPDLIRSKVLKRKSLLLVDHINEFNQMKLDGGYVNKKYQKVMRLIKMFNKNAVLNDLNEKWFYNFIRWMEGEGYKNSYIATIVSGFKTFVRHLNKSGLITMDANSLTYESRPVDTIYLNEQELEHLFNYPYKNTYIRSAVHSFLIGCYTGMRYVNFSKVNFDRDMIEVDGVKMIKAKAAKSNEMVYIPIHPNLQRIIDENVYSRISNQKLNSFIKLAAKEAGMNDQISLDVHKGGKEMIIQYRKWEKVTTHTARRSFATNAFKAGIPAQMIMKITGHKTESQFMKYLRVSGMENALLLSKHQFFSQMKVV